MTDTSVIEIAMQAMIISAKLGAPILITALAVGFGISLFQAATQIQEVTLSFVPKIIAVAVVVLLSGNWMLHELISFTQQLFDMLPRLLGGG
ncbi:MAG TPA: flagellar biosynthesis protein FliQ [Actinomycetes bacterium]|nr:flagellar biosynthesis protein FliQ [Actinomycetes bacterium]